MPKSSVFVINFPSQVSKGLMHDRPAINAPKNIRLIGRGYPYGYPIGFGTRLYNTPRSRTTVPTDFEPLKGLTLC